MSFKSDDIVKGVLDLAKTAQELEQVKQEHHELTLQVAQLKNNITILQRSNKEEQEIAGRLKAGKEKYRQDITQQISDLEGKRSALSNSLAPEVKQLETLKEQLEGLKNDADNRSKEAEDKFVQLAKNQVELESKKSILKQIKELAEKL